MFSYDFLRRENFTAEHQLTLKEMVIDHTHPGPILHDFDVLLNLIKANKLSLTPAQQLPLKTARDVNTGLVRPLQLGLQRPAFKSFPHVQGLFWLLRASGLTYVEGTPEKSVLALDQEMVQQWQTLNAAERYGSLLETWLVRAEPEILGERSGFWFSIPDNFDKSATFFFKLPDGGQKIAGNRDAEDQVKYWPGHHNLALLELFGLIHVKHGDPHNRAKAGLSNRQRLPPLEMP
jgi:hypothetical protein